LIHPNVVPAINFLAIEFSDCGYSDNLIRAKIYGIVAVGKIPYQGGKASKNVFELKKCVVLLCFFYENDFYGVLIKESPPFSSLKKLKILFDLENIDVKYQKKDYMSFFLILCRRLRPPHFLITPNTIRTLSTPITIMVISPQSRLFSMKRVTDAVAFP